VSSALPALPPAPTTSLDHLKALVLDTLPSAESKRAYGRALDRFLAWVQTEPSPASFNKALVQRYREHLRASGLSPSAVNLQMTAVRRLAAEGADNGLLAPELASGIGRVKGIRREGLRLGNWLTLAQAEQFLHAPAPATVKGKRDRALLAVLLGTGLRREEAAALTFEQIQQREGRWVIVDLRGKGGRVRSVPMPSGAKAALDIWTAAVGLTAGRVFRPVNKGGRVSGDGMTAQAIFNTVKHYAEETGLESIAPHDLRRSFAKLAHKGKASLEQIQLSLGHASVQTTERYLGVQQDLHDAPCDRLGLKWSAI
jgi:site-specific recombinase XerD